jgi:DNA invertase Pin-like site-specific DNA recombinase
MQGHKFAGAARPFIEKRRDRLVPAPANLIGPTPMIRERVMAGLARVRAEGKKKLGRPRMAGKKEAAIRARLDAGDGMLKIARVLGVGASTVRRVKAEMVSTQSRMFLDKASARA